MSAIYRAFDQATLDHQYNAQATVGDISPFIEMYTEGSAAARACRHARMAMGIAEVIPGISGGTIALILGVYERLIKAIHSFNISLISLLNLSLLIK